MATSVPRYTAEEVRRFPDDQLRYEVIRGELFALAWQPVASFPALSIDLEELFRVVWAGRESEPA